MDKSKIISLIASVIALLTSIISLLNTLNNTKRIESVEEKCPVELIINEPKSIDHVSTEVNVIGTASIHEECRFVFIIVRGVETSNQYWEVTDIVQIDNEGKWSGIATLNNISIGNKAKIHARVCNKPDIYRIKEKMSFPPVKGVLSNIVEVRRIR
jgi:hypothetical protein